MKQEGYRALCVETFTTAGRNYFLPEIEEVNDSSVVPPKRFGRDLGPLCSWDLLAAFCVFERAASGRQPASTRRRPGTIFTVGLWRVDVRCRQADAEMDAA